jgi:uncharacterized protein (DUF1330 family)
MTAYAIAQLRRVDVNDEIVNYLQTIDDTLTGYGGRFLVHGTTPEVVDGDFPGVVVVIEFPDVHRAYGWYNSPGYQAILPFRLRNADGGAVIVEGCPEGYRAASFVEKVPH